MLRSLLIIVSCLIFFSTIAIEPVYSRGGGGGGGCFGKETLILTPTGERSIDRLHPQDRVIGYSFSAKHQEIETIADVLKISTPNYYLINKHIKVTGTHPFYVEKFGKIKLIEVAKLKQGDLLINKNNSLVDITNIEYINKPLTVYNLISINPNHNFYADGLLVHNKGGSGGGGGYYRYGGGGGSSNTMAFTDKVFGGLLKALFLLTIGFAPIIYWRQLYNWIIYNNKQFTDDEQLIKFISTINYEFKNAYSMSYKKDNQIWIQVEPEIDELKYKCVISKEILITQVTDLFSRYQQDWTNQNFTSIEKYAFEPFKSKQKEIYRQTFGKNQDIIYDYQLSAIVPIKFEMRENLKRFIVQLNGSMTNFQMSLQGYILSGIPKARLFTEYWDIALDEENKCYLVTIYQVES